MYRELLDPLLVVLHLVRKNQVFYLLTYLHFLIGGAFLLLVFFHLYVTPTLKEH